MTDTPNLPATTATAEPAPTPGPSGAETSALVLWAYEAQQAHQIAISLAKTSFVPASLRGKPADITAAILAGQELGLRPMASLRSMDVIQGTPALRAHAMRGLVQSHGHRVWLVEQTPERVVMRGQRRNGLGFDPEQESVWTIERAQQLGLTGKDQWKKQPATMLTARATGEICRLVAADVLYAMPYAIEELHESPPSDSTGPAPQRVTAAEIMGAPVEEPSPQAEPPAAPAAKPAKAAKKAPSAPPRAEPALETGPPADMWEGEAAQPGAGIPEERIP